MPGVRSRTGSGGVAVDLEAALDRARQAHLHGRWGDAADAFAEVDAISPLDVDDLDRLAEALDLVGRGDDAVAVLRRVYAARVAARQIESALRNAFWLYRALAFNAMVTLHVTRRAGHNAHHVAEACFKAAARALRMAAETDPMSQQFVFPAHHQPRSKQGSLPNRPAQIVQCQHRPAR